MKLLYLDCFSGISGDMLLGALIDLGAPPEIIEGAFKTLDIPPVRLKITPVEEDGISAKRVVFDFEEPPQTSRTYRYIRSLVDDSVLPFPVKEASLKVFEQLARAEAKVHGMEVDEVHFHEVGGIDTICDVVGAMAALEALEVESVYVSPLPFGRGAIRCRHGILPNPAPATLELLEGFELYPLPFEMEFVTPTGAAILRSKVDPDRSLPPFRVASTGYGRGTQKVPGRPNILRAVLGFSEKVAVTEEVLALETEVDDESPEVLAHVAQSLFGQGALDVTLLPVVMKKGRLGTRISVVAPIEAQKPLSEFLLRETSTLGVRFYHAQRRIAGRRIVTVTTSLGKAVVKVAELGEGLRRVTPEYDACVHLAEIHHLPLKQVMEVVKREAEKDML